MSLINLRDNNYKGVTLEKAMEPNSNYEKAYKNLCFIANSPLKSLVEKSENLLIFPPDLESSKDKIGDSPILESSFDESNDYSKVKIYTNNLMGFIGFGDSQISITSRFCNKNNKDFFLHYLLQKVFDINLFNFNFSIGPNGYFDLLIYMFPHFLKRAGNQGIYREYRTFKRNDNKVKGTIDVKRYFRLNIPFDGNIAYNSREYTYDNHVTELIRHTIEYIKCKSNGMKILSGDYETNKIVNQIYQATPSYSKDERQRVIGQNLRQVSHPYFTEYLPLQRLCLQILQNEKLCYQLADKKVYGLLFDGAWLWEEFLYTVISHKNRDIIHPRNKDGTEGIKLFYNSRTSYYPDFRLPKKNNHEESVIILDAKYKDMKINNDEDFEDVNISIQRDDKFQMISYIHVQNAEKGIFLYPYKVANYNKKELPLILRSKDLKIKGMQGIIYSKGIPILSEASDFIEYRELMDSIMNSFTFE
jgi:5-methylcytosine-specific restriction endonuclease McrBC regulatory subunit McrC